MGYTGLLNRRGYISQVMTSNTPPLLVHTLCSPSSIMHLHILPLKITAFDLKHLSFAVMQQNIIQSHSFDPAADYVTNFLYSLCPYFSLCFIQFHLSKTQRGFQGINCSHVFLSNLFFPTTANNLLASCPTLIHSPQS